VASLPAFYTFFTSPRYGTFAIDVYHERNECPRALRILEDHAEVFGKVAVGSAVSAASLR
jgi:hypothetical protein